MIKRLKMSNVFYKFLLSYILVILIPILGLGSLSYLVFSSSIQKEAQRNNALILSNMSDTLDQQLTNTKNMMYQTVLNLNGSAKDYNKLQEAITLLSRIANTDKFIDDIFVYYPETNQVIRSDGLYQADYFFEHFYQYEDPSPITKLDSSSHNDFSVIPTGNIRYKDHDPKKMVTFLTSFPLYNQRTDGTLFVLVNSDKLQSIITQSLHGSADQSQILITNEDAQTIAFSKLSKNSPSIHETTKLLNDHLPDTGAEFMNIKQGDISLSAIHSKVIDWKYIVLTSIHQTSQQADSIRFLTLLICVILLVVGVVLAVVIAHNFTKPVYEIMNIFKADSRLNSVPTSRKDEFQIILQHLRLVMSDHQMLEKSSEINQKLLKDYYVKSIILGDDVKKTEKTDKLETLFVYSLFTVIVIRVVTEDLAFEPYSQESYIKNHAIDVVESLLTGHNEIVALLTNTGGSTISILANFQNEVPLRQHLELIRDRLSEEVQTRIWIGVGNFYQSLHRIDQSYKEATSVLQYRSMSAKPQILYYADYSDAIQHVPITADIENQLTWALLAGDDVKATEHLNLLFAQLNDDHNFAQIQQCGHNLIRIIDKVLSQNQLHKSKVLGEWYDLLHVNDTFTLNEIKDHVTKTFQKVCAYFSDRSGSQDKQLEEDLRAYIYQYYNRDLSLDLISSNFNMNSKYVSRFFKERFGINFLDFLNQYRIMRAKELLIRDPQLRINQIANQVGIGNVNTFISVFKKYEGVTPGKYRDLVEANM
ncbi:helix-turn-helix domain-containing protein [Paenibacillus cremeus]|uniref:AraC family transcriptional regulator n=1 Tax=Paenibacillus cremeus TaxID=2163881 RepID=A0A559K4W2_9BACL|nr:helix-turn-helix domain-containing protein [Paenibacillus cremeus]TVY07182.1 AraC family transcriptional regulator [Paenibacillus cremeus]